MHQSRFDASEGTMSLERRIAFEIYWRSASRAFHGANYAPHNSKITGLRTDGLVLSKANMDVRRFQAFPDGAAMLNDISQFFE